MFVVGGAMVGIGAVGVYRMARAIRRKGSAPVIQGDFVANSERIFQSISYSKQEMNGQRTCHLDTDFTKVSSFPVVLEQRLDTSAKSSTDVTIGLVDSDTVLSTASTQTSDQGQPSVEKDQSSWDGRTEQTSSFDSIEQTKATASCLDDATERICQDCGLRLIDEASTRFWTVNKESEEMRNTLELIAFVLGREWQRDEKMRNWIIAVLGASSRIYKAADCLICGGSVLVPGYKSSQSCLEFRSVTGSSFSLPSELS